MRQFTAQGIATEKIAVDVMIAWCHRNGYEIDDKGRAIFGTVLAMSRDIPEAMDAPFDDPSLVIQ